MKKNNNKPHRLRIKYTVFPDGTVLSNEPEVKEDVRTKIIVVIMLILFIFTLLILGTMIYYSASLVNL